MQKLNIHCNEDRFLGVFIKFSNCSKKGLKIVWRSGIAEQKCLGHSIREVLKNSTPHPSSRGEGGLDPLSHNLLQKV